MVTGILGMHTALARGWSRNIALAAIGMMAALVIAPALLLLRRPHGSIEKLLPTKTAGGSPVSDASPSTRFTGPVAQTRAISWLVFVTTLILLAATLVFFGWFLWTKVLDPEINPTLLALRLERYASYSMASPAATILCVFAAIYAAIFAGLRRISLLGSGYAALAAESATFRLLAGAPVSPRAVSHGGQSPTGRAMDVTQLPLVRLLDMPVQNLAWPYAVGMVVLLVTIWWAVSGPSTVDGVPFSRFVLCASALVLGSAFLLLAQAIEIWRRLRPGLLALSHSRIEPGLASVAKVVRWNLSLVSPHLSDLAPLASRADRLYLRLLVLAAAGAKVPRRPDPATSDRKPESHDYAKVLRGFLNRGPEGLFRDVDFDMAAAATTPLQLATLNDELEQREYAPLLQSQTWFHLWGISDQLVGLLEKVHWPRCEPTALSKTSESSRKRTRQRHNPDATPGAANSSHALVKGKDAWEPRALDIEARRRNLSKWLNDCETLIALQCGLVLRDILARLMSCLFTAMVCLTLLTAGHLFYLFQGRSSFLTVDLIAVTCASAIAVWLLVAMERDPVLSRLRHTTPGRVDVNWEFLKRVGLYGVLPLVAVLGSLFPEIQEPLLGWLDPLRKLVSF